MLQLSNLIERKFVQSYRQGISCNGTVDGKARVDNSLSKAIDTETSFSPPEKVTLAKGLMPLYRVDLLYYQVTKQVANR